MPHLRSRALVPALLASLLAATTCDAAPPRPPAPPGHRLPKSAEWQAVQKLIDAQKMQAASDAVAKLRERARQSGDDAEFTEALIKEVQLRIALGGYETAVRFLRDQPWPKSPLERTALDLFYAHALTAYLQSYSWEIRQREKIESKGPIDLKKWTAEQIFVEALGACQQAWSRRESLGRQPVEALADYLTPNNYPREIRGTLRDAVSYFIVGLLADTAHWRPEQSNDLFRLDLAALVRGRPAVRSLRIDDPERHPLERMGAVLDDLEGWHADSGQKEAALEARLERIRRLWASFTDETSRQAIKRQLETRLAASRALPWWSVGQELLAEMARDEGDLVRARAIAQAGAKAYPSSIGGQRCNHLVKAIEAPDFQLTAMASDGAGKRSIQVTHKNLERVYFRAYAVDLINRVDNAHDYNLLPAYSEFRALVPGKPDVEWTATLPATPDYQSHQSFVTPPLPGRGLYTIFASAHPDFRERGNRVLAVNLVITDLVLVTRSDPPSGNLEVVALSGASGKPQAGVDVALYKFDWQRKHTKVESKRTDGEGLVTFKSGSRGSGGGSYFVVARRARGQGPDEDVAALGNAINFYTQRAPAESLGSLVYTDRSIYRPLQKLDWKVIAYRGRSDQGSFHTAAGEKTIVTLVDANNQEVDKREVKTNDFGSASGEFTLPAGRLLGRWVVRCSHGNGEAQVRVEEYKRPTFEVTLKDPASPLRLNQASKLTGEAKYYFGLPVVAGSVRWRVTRSPIYPWWWWWQAGQGGAQTQTVATGVAALEAAGAFHIAFTPLADEKLAKGGRARDVTYRYTVHTDLTDEGGETRSAERTYRLGLVTVEATLATPGTFLRQAERGEVTLTRTDLDGVPRAGAGSWRLVALVQPAKTVVPSELPWPAASDGGAPRTSGDVYRTPGDGLRPRGALDYSAERAMADWTDGEDRGHGEVTHDAKGVAKLVLPELLPGAYRLRYQTTDPFGARYETWKDLIVAAPAGQRTPLALPALLEVERASVKVGETARFLALSGLPHQPVYLDRFRDGHLVERRRLSSESGTLIEIPIRAADRGGFGLSLWLVRDHQPVVLTHSVFVPWDDKQLTVELATFRDKIRPGEQETWRAIVKGAGAEAGAAELLAYMYDRSLDLFAPHAPPSPMSLYPSHAAVSQPSFSVSLSGAQWVYNNDFAALPGYPALVPDSLTFFDAYGIGGVGVRYYRGGYHALSMAATASPAPPASPAREESFKRKAGPRSDMSGDVDQTLAFEDAEADQPGTGGQPQGQSATPAAPAIRSNFSETAFFAPHLITDGKGSATIEFTVPDSVTGWNVWVHAVTRDLRSGSLSKPTRSVKELMVRPYLPRFFREGDRADLKVVVNNASEGALAGTLELDVVDPETQASVRDLFGVKTSAQPFRVAAGASANITFPVVAPKRVGLFAFRVVARAGNLSDGELRPLPVLPGRLHLAQSRFVTLRDADKRVMKFADLAKADDPTMVQEQMVVTVDAQLFYTVLKALPYLIHYPYECTEQTVNRFVSTGIVSSMFKDYPAVAKMAEKFAARKTQLEAFDAPDPNRKMALEESPWLEAAHGGDGVSADLINVLDPRVARENRDTALLKLKKMQNANGSFPWFPGGPPSPYMTLYLVHSFAKAAEFGAFVPKDVVQRAWSYLALHYREHYIDLMRQNKADWEFLTFLNYAASSFPDSSYTGSALTDGERKEILDYCFRHWKAHSPYLKGMLALTLKRMGRKADGIKVFESVMDSAKTLPDQGTFWAQEDRSWLWYNDTIESHAFALRVLLELAPEHGDWGKKKDGLVLWLLLNKKLNQWKSTRATAEVIYSLIHYLKNEGALGIREDATVHVGSLTKSYVFEPDSYAGKQQIVVPGSQIDPLKSSTITVEKQSKGIVFASATWHFSTEKLPAEARGDFFVVSRAYFKRESTGHGFVLKPVAEGQTIQAGDEIEVQISLRSKHQAEYVHLRDPRAAGLEPDASVSQYKWDLGIGWYEETRDSGANFFFESLPAGEYAFKYRLRANLAGTFRVGPATVQSMYAPEFNAYSAGNTLTVK